ncbi:MAG: IS110 family transposase [Chloroflexi bacterium]|nr:IS110 family transposase [Chloroflexota bacterium]MBM3172508.1 IS110 family transposase [Chloroflexota bacterium]MBM4447372.1 IS110 family transposase [Chloroflexota bacterium]
MKYIGLDCHKQYDFATLIDSDTGEIRSKKLAHKKEEFKSFIGSRRDTKMVIESCWNWSRTYELAKDLVDEVILAHPLKIKAIASAKIKTDAIDSRTLAQLLKADLIPQAHLREADNRIKQKVIRHRAFMVAMRTRVKNKVNDLVNNRLLSPSLEESKPKNLFSKRGKGENGVAWLKSLEWPVEEDKRIFESSMRLIEQLSFEISASNQMVEEIYKKDKDAQLLSTIPGIGKTLAVLISTEIDGIDRFKSPSKLCSYAGLVPSTHSSGGKTYHGKMILEGNRWLQWALVEAVVPASYADVGIRQRLNALRKIKKANVAKVIMARWMLKLVYHVLKEGRSYVPSELCDTNRSRLSIALASS